jgi:hypothetical protein
MNFLSFSSQVVKVFILFAAPHITHASSDIFISKGEQIEIGVKSLKSFSVGNNEVIKYKYRPKLKNILIKGKSLGFSDLVIWTSSTKKKTYSIYVTSKRSQLKQMQIIQALNKTKLETRIAGELIEIFGKVQSLSEYFIIKNIQSSKLENVIINTSISNKLKNKIISDTYIQLYEQGIEYIRCFVQDINIHCKISDSKKLAKLSSLKKKYFITFSAQINQIKHKNYNLNFEIVSIESTNQMGFSSGLSKVEFDITKAIETDKVHLLSENFILKDDEINAQLISSPQIVGIVNKPFKLALGSEIPFRTRSIDRQEITQWKFAGLTLKGKMFILNGKLALGLTSKITSPNDNQISGPEGNTTLYLKPSKAQILFSINMEVKNEVKSSIPIIKEIPILRDLFLSSTEQFSHKKILVYVILKEIAND